MGRKLFCQKRERSRTELGDHSLHGVSLAFPKPGREHVHIHIVGARSHRAQALRNRVCYVRERRHAAQPAQQLFLDLRGPARELHAPKDFDDGLADHAAKEDLPGAEEGVGAAGSERREHKPDLVPSEEGEMG